jgi:hypothetical protein
VLLGAGYVTSTTAAVLCTMGANGFIGLASGGGCAHPSLFVYSLSTAFGF